MKYKLKFEITFPNMDKAGRLITIIDTVTKYYIFVEEIKTISENREEKLNDIL